MKFCYNQLEFVGHQLFYRRNCGFAYFNALVLIVSQNIYTSRLLTKQPLDITLFKVNGECVHSLWAALSLELFYMTNDDDERYSIQALPGVLRNIITQSADPPLGYPVFSSGFVNMTFF